MQIRTLFLSALFAIGSLASLSSQAQAIEWPAPTAAVVPGGTFPMPDRMRTFGPGMTREQVIANIGTPHFLDTQNKPNVWNYLLNFRAKPNQNEHITCQFQILFKGELTAGYAWSPASCASAIQGAQAAANEKDIEGMGPGNRPQECLRCRAPAPSAPVAAAAPIELPPITQVAPVFVQTTPDPEPQKIELAGDALFKFGGGDFEHLLPGGKDELDRISKELKGSSLEKLEVHGFTDSLGADSINMPLSIKRAATVRAYLQANGVRASEMRVQGHGSDVPVKVCSGPREERIACEAPNRRVLIKAFGVARKF